MNKELQKLKDIVSPNCITIILNTHRTRPSNNKDPVILKNLVSEAENRLLEQDSKKDVDKLIKSLKKLADSIDHNQNLESLILFVNEDIAQYTRLPIPVEDRVIIDNTFATRDLVRALHTETDYYILILDQKRARLIEAFNDKFVKEITKGFPIKRKQLFSRNKAELANAGRQTKLDAEFYNRVDKAVNNVRKDNPLPVLVCAQEATYHEYIKVADKKNSLFESYLNLNRLDEKDHIIVKQAWDIVEKDNKARNDKRKKELTESIGSGKFLNDVNEIWNALNHGRIRTLFIEQGLFQPAVIDGNDIVFVPEEDITKKEVIDDIYDEMIEINMTYGGDVVFLPKGELEDFDGFGAIARY